MATLYTHAIAGLGIARAYVPKRRRWLYWLLAVFLPLVPDFDAFSSAPYGAMLGHRGLTHSILFALWLGLLAASLTFRAFNGSIWVLAVVFVAIVTSHGILDALTRGGAAIPFFWPFADERIGNWGPIPVCDLGFEIPNPWRSRALRSELLWVWLPVGAIIGLATVYRLLKRSKPPGCRAA